MPALFPGQQIIDVYEITDGLNTVKSGVRIGPTELKDCQNIRYFPRGGLSWRPGYSTLGNNTGNACTGLYMARFSNNTNIAIRTQGTSFEYMSNLNGTWVDGTNGVTITGGQDNVFVFDILNDIVVGVNGADTPIQFGTGLTASTISGLPFSTASACFTHRGYMFYITTDKAYFSDIRNPTTVGTNNYVQPGSKQGGNLAGGVDYNGKCYLFRRHGIYGVEFQPTAVDSSGNLFPFVTAPTPIVPGVGTQSHRSIVKFTTPATHKTPGQELVFFVDQFGVPRLFDGTTTISIGASILTSRDSSIVSLANMNKSRLGFTWAINDVANNLIYVFMTSGSGSKHDVCWIMDYNLSFAWARDSYYDQFNCGAIFENSSGVFTPYFANYTGQAFATSSTQTDNGQAISSYARLGDLYKNSPALQNKWTYLELRGATGDDSQTVMIDVYADGDDTSSVSSSLILAKSGQPKWDQVTWDQFNWAYSGLTTKSLELSTEAKTLGIKISNSTSGNTLTLEGLSLFIIPEGWAEEQ